MKLLHNKIIFTPIEHSDKTEPYHVHDQNKFGSTEAKGGL